MIKLAIIFRLCCHHEDYQKEVSSQFQAQLITHCCYAAINEKEVRYNGGKSINEKAKLPQYDERGLDQRAINIGVEIGKKLQFNHRTRGLDGVTYGCFGYLDEYGDLVSKFYLADTHGYRILNTSSDVVLKVFPVANNLKYSPKIFFSSGRWNLSFLKIHLFTFNI